jgi:hypothetical protein
MCGYGMGMFPPGSQHRELRRRFDRILCDAHRVAVQAIREAAPGCQWG